MSKEHTVRKGRTRDANGRVVKMIDPYLLWLRGANEPIERSTLESIAVELGIADKGRHSRRWVIVVSAIGVALVVLGLVAMVAIEGQPAMDDLISTLTNPAIMGAVIGGAVVPFIVARQQRLAKLRTVLLKHNVCVHCGYSLVGLPIENDVRTCPECACAWPSHEPAGASEAGSTDNVAGRNRVALVLLLLGILLFGVFAALYVALR